MSSATPIAQRLMSEQRHRFNTLPTLRGCGVYAYFLDPRTELPGVLVDDTRLLYVGMTEDSLDVRNHFGHKTSGFSTFRRSLGALLKSQLRLRAIPRGPGSSATNIKCYRFSDEGEKALSEWMRQHLTCIQIAIDLREVRELERELLAEMQPPLNLTGWANPQRAYIKELRATAAAEAERNRDSAGVSKPLSFDPRKA